MLVLSRFADEKILIGKKGDVLILDKPIEITVVEVSSKKQKVRLGIEAQPNIDVHREEIFNKIHDGEEK